MFFRFFFFFLTISLGLRAPKTYALFETNFLFHNNHNDTADT